MSALSPLCNKNCRMEIFFSFLISSAVKFADERLVPCFFQINVWDTAGMERTRSLTSNYYRNAHAVIFVYAIDDTYSLTVLHNWVQDVDKDAKTALKFLVGNKVDLADESSEVDKNQAELLCKNSGLHSLYHVSAKTGAGVKEMFYDIAKLMVHNKKATHHNKDAFAIIADDNEDGKKTKSSNCC